MFLREDALMVDDLDIEFKQIDMAQCCGTCQQATRHCSVQI